MRGLICRLFLSTSLSTIAALATADVTFAQQVVGAVGAVNPATTGRAPNHAIRDLRAGDSIFFQDRIVTKRSGSAQLTFLDRSTLNVGENSDVVIDQFVYRPGGAGAMSATLTKGMLRFVGGQISHDDGITIKTPVVTIGIRGGVGTIGYIKDAADAQNIPGVPADFRGGAIVVNSFGSFTLHNDVSDIVLSRPGFAVFIGSRGEPIGAPVRFDLAAAQMMLAKLTSKTNQHGGAKPMSNAIASAMAAAPAVAIPVAVPVRPSINALDFTAVFSAASAVARNRSEARQAARQYQAFLAAASVATTVPIVTAPVVTTPVTSAVVTTPVVATPVTAPLVITPVATTPVTAPIVTTSVGTTPVMAPVTTSVVTKPVATPVGVITTTGVTITIRLSPGNTPVVTTITPSSKPGTTIVVGKGADNGIGNGGVNNGNGNGKEGRGGD